MTNTNTAGEEGWAILMEGMTSTSGIADTSASSSLVPLQADKPIAVNGLPLRDKEERVGLAHSLWAEGIVCTVAEKSHSSARKNKKLKHKP